ncbi:MAG: hypothetical protein ABI866_10795 [Dokdonella sp.]
MNVLRALVLSTLIFSLAGCGGGADQSSANGAGAASASFGDVAFTTYSYMRFRLVFISDSKVKKTWANMAGPAVVGSFTKNGNEIEVQWDPKAEHHGSLSEKFRQMGPCSMARYVWVDKKGEVHDDSPQVFERTVPKCDTVRVTN